MERFVLRVLTCLPAPGLVGSVKPLKENLKKEGKSMETVKKVLDYIFVAVSVYFIILVLCAG